MPEQVRIVVDSREQGEVEKHLKGFAELTRKALPCGDFVCSERVAVERKAVPDFLASLKDQRLFSQLRELAESYERPVLMIEGNPDGLFSNGFPANAVRGALSSIAVDYRIPILWTSGARETALQVFWLAHREQVGGRSGMALRPEKPRAVAGVEEWQEFVVGGLPGISQVRARKLLEHFKSPADLALATVEQLAEVEGIGPKTAESVFQVLHALYASSAKRGK